MDFRKIKKIKPMIVRIVNLGLPILSAIVASHSIFASTIDKWEKTYPAFSFIWTRLDGICLIGICIICVFSLIDTFCLKPNVRKLQDENEHLKHENDFLSNQVRNTLKGYVNSLAPNKLPNFTEQERINIYLFHKDTQIFTLEARFCANPEHNKIKNKEYLLKKGCIYRGWIQGYFFDNKFPKGKRDYYRYVKSHYQITGKELDKISKHSHLYFVMRIDDNNQNPLGVLVLESENSNYMTCQDLAAIFNQEKEFLHHILKTFITSISRDKDSIAEEL